MTTASNDTPPLWGLPEEHVKAVLEGAVTRTYPKNAVLINQGDRSDSLYYIVSGKVKIYLSDDTGKEVILGSEGSGEFFGELALDEGPRSASVMTLEPCTLRMISRAQVIDYLLKHPDAAILLLRTLAHRVRDLTKRVGDLVLKDVYQRLVQMLLEMAVQQDGKLVVKERLTQEDIAKRVGSSREMISRIFKDLRKGGYVETDEHHQITILKKPPAAW